MSRQHHQAWSGFTLIELMVVVAIVLIISVGAVALTGPFVQRRQVEAAAVSLVQDLRLVQSQAIFTRSYLAVTLDVPNNSYSVQRSPGGTMVVTRFNSTVGYASVVLGASFVGNCVYFTSGSKSTSASPASVTFYFSPRGVPMTDQSGSGVIESGVDGKGAVIALASSGGAQIEIRISPVIGKITREWQ